MDSSENVMSVSTDGIEPKERSEEYVMPVSTNGVESNERSEEYSMLEETTNKHNENIPLPCGSNNDCDLTNNNIINDEITDHDVDEQPELTAAQILLDLRFKYVSAQDNETTENEAGQSTENEAGQLNKNQDKQHEREKITLMQLLKTEGDLKVFTRINFTLLKNLDDALKMCEKKADQYGCSTKERIVLTLCKLKLNLTFKCLSITFFSIYS